MSEQEFPANSRKSKVGDPEPPKRVERVVTGEAKRRRKPLGKQFMDTFVGGDPKEAARQMISGVIIPSARDMIVDAITQGAERLIFGETRRRSSSSRPGGVSNYVNYATRAAGAGRTPEDHSPRLSQRRTRSGFNFQEISIPTRAEAEEVLSRLDDLVDQYDTASVADLYALVGLKAAHTDQRWGWTSVRGSTPRRLRDGTFLLDLPDPEPLT
jgi:hypothetical protein